MTHVNLGPNVAECRWKYLRETTTKYFDAARNTSLPEYLEYIFNDNTFVYNTRIPKDIILSRDPAADIKLYRPDARCEELNLIVEFDGVAHYQDQQVVFQDIKKDKYLQSLGYSVVRIPYWIQLSRDVIYYLFECVRDKLTLSESDRMCELPYSFFNPDTADPCLHVSVGAMSEAGRDRFLKELTSMPFEVQTQVYLDLYTCACYLPNNLHDAEYLVPSYIMQRWGIEQYDYQYADIEHKLFDRSFTYLNYAATGFSMFDISYDYYKELISDDSIEFNIDLKASYLDWSFVKAASMIMNSIRYDSHVYHMNVGGIVIDPSREDVSGIYLNSFSFVHDDEFDTSLLFQFLQSYSSVVEHHEDSNVIYVWW